MQPHHFQQSDRYMEAQIAGLARGTAPYVWGLKELTIDDELLRLGKFAIKSCEGITPDGSTFRVPAVDDLPPAMEIPLILLIPGLSRPRARLDSDN